MMSFIAFDTALIVSQVQTSANLSTLDDKHVDLALNLTETGLQNDSSFTVAQVQSGSSSQHLRSADVFPLFAVILILSLLFATGAKQRSSRVRVSKSKPKQLPSKSSTPSKTVSKPSSKSKMPKSNSKKPKFTSSPSAVSHSTLKPMSKQSTATQFQALRELKPFKLSNSNRTKRETVPPAK
eukprot:1392756-Amorphochlora_amoeboformis.AAC.1